MLAVIVACVVAASATAREDAGDLIKRGKRALEDGRIAQADSVFALAVAAGKGDEREEALFLRASVWREFAEHVAGSLTKGSRVIASGRLKQRSYETKEGEKRTSIELEVDEIGPSLRYATATVTRAQSNRGAVGGGSYGGGQSDDAWAPSTPAAKQGGGDVWNTPGTSYGDETPF